MTKRKRRKFARGERREMIHVLFTRAEKRRLQDLARSQGTTVSELVRQAVFGRANPGWPFFLDIERRNLQLDHDDERNDE